MENVKVGLSIISRIDYDKFIGLVIGAGMLGWSFGNWLGVAVLVAFAAFFCFNRKNKQQPS